MNVHKWLAIFVMAMLVFAPVRGLAEDATPVAGGDTDPLFSVSLSVDMIPNPIGHVVFERLTFNPDTEIVVAGSEEWVRARLQQVESGSLEVTPIVESSLWRTGEVDSESVPAGSTVLLNVGDAIFLPALDQAEADGLGDYRFLNPGEEAAVTIGFHLHSASGSEYSGLPDGVLSAPSGTVGSVKSLQPFADVGGVAVFRSITIEPDGMLLPPADAALTVYLVESGTARYEMVKDGKVTTELRWRSGSVNAVTPYEGVDQQLVNRGDTSLTVLELSLIPAD